MTTTLFEKAKKMVQENPQAFKGANPFQVNLANEEDSGVHRDGDVFCLRYDPFPGNWRLTNTITLAYVPMKMLDE
mgnify:CR=1 FL=1